MDEAGIQASDSFCSIAGYIAPKEEWDKFERDWTFVLNEYMKDVPPPDRYFHALEFYGNDKKFRKWKKGKRRSFEEALFRAIGGRQLALFTSSVDSRVFFSLTEDERRFLTGGVHNGMKWKKHGAPSKPYFLPFQFCIIQSAGFIRDCDKVFPVMSRQEQYKMKALELYEMMLGDDSAREVRDRLADHLAFSDWKKVPGLQAADLAVYWFGQFATAMVRNGGRGLTAEYPHRIQYLRLLKNVRSLDDLKLFDFNGLMLALQFSNRYLKSSFVTRDQLRPSLPIEERRRILSVMRKADLRKFLDHWQPNSQAHRVQSGNALAGHTEPPILRWIRHASL